MKKWLILLAVILLGGCGSPFGSAEFEKEDYKLMAEANNRFAFDLLEELKKSEDGENLFFSPTSIHMAFSMTYNGADGETLEEMANVLHIKDFNKEEVNQANASFLSKTLEKDFSATLNIANSLWIQKDYPFLEEFVTKTKDYYLAEVREMDFLDKKSLDEINGWVEKKTSGKIKKLLDQIRPDTVAYLINAIYFKGDWEYPFEESQTFEDDFHLADGEKKLHPFMSQMREFPYFEDDFIQGIELPYKDNELSMIVLLPKEGKTLADLRKQLSFEQWNSWLSQFQETQGRILLPKFTTEYSVTLNDALINLGMPTAFTGLADFSQMVENDGVYIDEVRHKSFIEVNEKGTEAAASTSVAIVETAAFDQFEMEVNRPFFFAIKDNESGMILFMGEIHEPEMKN